MQLICESDDLQNYLVETEEINYSNHAIVELVRSLTISDENEHHKIRSAFHYVRDSISHSWDIQSRRITITASEVLLHKEGICYAKSNLLASLLRLQGIPTGFCYQRLTIGDTPNTGYCIHAMNAVYFQEHKRWIRLDARGNKEGVSAQFSGLQDALAFSARPLIEEVDYPTIYARPHPSTLVALKRNTDALHMYLNDLPTSL